MTDKSVPLWDIAMPIFVADVVPITGGPTGRAVYRYPTGTGFVVAPGVLVTCWHCVRPTGEGEHVAVGFHGGEISHYLLSKIAQDPCGADLATAALDCEPWVPVYVSPEGGTVGNDVWAVGFPFPDSDLLPSGMRTWQPVPRLLRGYVTRHFQNTNHRTFGPQQSYELDMTMPSGMSGAPILERPSSQEGLGLLGVAYGGHDSYSIMEETTVGEKSGERLEVRRYVSFGWAHHQDRLLALRGQATDDRPLRELLKAPS